MTPSEHHDPADPLEQELESALAPGAELDPVDAGDAVRRAFGSWRRARRRRQIAGGSVLVLLLAVGAWGFLQSRDRPASDNGDSVAYARTLYERARNPSGDGFNLSILEDPEVRAEYLAALDHEASIVRRIAVNVLAYSRVPIPGARLTRLLTENREDLDKPLELAGIGDASRAIASALERQRAATLAQVLRRIWTASSQGRMQVAPEHIEPFAHHESAVVRAAAVRALAVTRGYVISNKVRRLMSEDPDRTVRFETARMLIRHLGEEGAREVIEYMRSLEDPEMELKLIHEASKGATFSELAQAKVADPEVPPVVSLSYARALARDGDKEPLLRLLPTVFAGSDPAAIFVGVQVCREFHLDDLRGQAVVAWRRLDRVDRADITVSLVGWDLESGDQARMLAAVARARTEGLRRLRFTMKKHLEAPDPEVRKAVRSLLDDWAQADD